MTEMISEAPGFVDFMIFVGAQIAMILASVTVGYTIGRYDAKAEEKDEPQFCQLYDQADWRSRRFF